MGTSGYDIDGTRNVPELCGLWVEYHQLEACEYVYAVNIDACEECGGIDPSISCIHVVSALVTIIPTCIVYNLHLQ